MNSPRTIAFTCAAVNYLPKVRKLFASIRRHHPEFECVLALADELPGELALDEPDIDRVLVPGELDIPDVRPWIFQHDIVELSTAIKPFALKKLLGEPGVAQVFYFDPDMILFSRVDDIAAVLAGGANLALTPHQTTPDTSLEAIRDNEIASLKHGVFNLGFIAVRRSDESARFAGWWADRLYHFCIADTAAGLFTDQKWMNFAPIYFDGVHILKSPRFNVATWNLTTRRLSGDHTRGFLVNGEPLGFYHFTGFDSGAHRQMAAKNAGDSPAVFDLIQWYEDETLHDDLDPLSKHAWGYARFSDGSPIPKAARVLYRQRLDLQRAFPDPFIAGGDNDYRAWLAREFGAPEAAVAATPAPGGRWKRLLRGVSGDPAYRKSLARRAWTLLRHDGPLALLRHVFRR